MYDIALTHDEETGEIVVHAANCPLVRKLANEGHEVATLLGCKSMPTGLKQHSCMRHD